MYLQLRVKNIFKNFFSKSWQHQKNKFIFALTKIINNKKCYAYSYISKQRIGLVPRETLLFAGHMLLLNKVEKRIRYNTDPRQYRRGFFIVQVLCKRNQRPLL